jgi:hypothetical protein
MGRRVLPQLVDRPLAQQVVPVESLEEGVDGEHGGGAVACHGLRLDVVHGAGGGRLDGEGELERLARAVVGRGLRRRLDGDTLDQEADEPDVGPLTEEEREAVVNLREVSRGRQCAGHALLTMHDEVEFHEARAGGRADSLGQGDDVGREGLGPVHPEPDADIVGAVRQVRRAELFLREQLGQREDARVAILVEEDHRLRHGQLGHRTTAGVVDLLARCGVGAEQERRNVQVNGVLQTQGGAEGVDRRKSRLVHSAGLNMDPQEGGRPSQRGSSRRRGDEGIGHFGRISRRRS